jgi:hypothetical protein
MAGSSPNAPAAALEDELDDDVGPTDDVMQDQNVDPLGLEAPQQFKGVARRTGRLKHLHAVRHEVCTIQAVVIRSNPAWPCGHAWCRQNVI